METIYLLSDPRTNEPRYVGVTSRDLNVRLKQHRHQALSGRNRPVCDWYRKLLRMHLTPTVIVIETTEDRNREAYWISYYREQYPRMLNIAPGGNHAPSSDPRVAAKIAASLRGKKLPQEVIDKLVAARAGFRHSEETRAKMRRPKTPEHRANAAAALNAKRAAGECRVLSGPDNPMFGKSLTRGMANGLAKLTDSQVLEMRRLFAAGAASTEIARLFGIKQATAHRIIVGQSWAHLPGASPLRGKGKRPTLRLFAV